MRFLDTAKTIVFGDQNNRQAHGFRAGFVPFLAPSLLAAGAVAMGAPVALAVGAVAGVVVSVAGISPALMVAKDAGEMKGYNFKRFLAGMGAGGALGAALAFSVVAGLPQEQPKAPVAGPVLSTVKSDKGRCGRDFNPAVITDDPLGQKIYMIAAQVNCLSQPNP